MSLSQQEIVALKCVPVVIPDPGNVAELVNTEESFDDFLRRQSDRELMIFAIHKMAAVDNHVSELMQYVKDLDEKARSFGDPQNMEKMMSGFMQNMMGM
jgi:nuclear transport factor 2 (NTF2) superfamily protein